MDPREVLELVARSAATTGVAEGGPADGGSGGEGPLVHLERVPARPARTEPVPRDLPEVVRRRLGLLGVERLYRHQARCLEAVRAGRHVTIATATASGKTLAYQLPVVERLLTDPATALYLAPTKALARDQLRVLRRWRLPQLRPAVVDGDTPAPEREAIRRTANWVLTNPDLLHHSLLPDHSRWAEFLHHLAYVVVDECHVARGVFGSHVALVLRRLRRLAERYGAAPTFVLASATTGNPAEHAGALTGLAVEAIQEDGSPRGPFELGLWQAPFVDPDLGWRRSVVAEAGELLAAFAGAGVQTLVFVRSRRGTEVVAAIARERLRHSAVAGAIAAYRAGYLPEERRELEEGLVSGRLVGVAATQALELGIDVGGLDAVVLAGYPGTAAAFWQRLGRAGRGGGPAVGVLVADDDPLDQYLVAHPRELIDRFPEDAVIDPSNPHVLAPHLRAACQEQPLDDADAARWFGPAAPALLAADADAGRLRRRAGRHYWTGRRRAAAEVDIRSAGGRTFRIVDADTGAVIGDVDEARAYRHVHTGAIYLHQGDVYEVDDLDLARGVAAARPAPAAAHTTRARATTRIRVLEAVTGVDRDGVGVRLGRVKVTDQVVGYDVVEPATRRVVDRRPLDLPPTSLETVALWWTISPALLDRAGITPRRVVGALHAAEHAAIGLLPLIALCDRWDIGGLSTPSHPDTDLPTVFVYDGHPGGAGLVERSYRRLREHLGAARDAVAACRCRSGCPSCVHSPKCGNGNEPLDKHGAVAVLDLVLDRIAAPAGTSPRQDPAGS